MIILIRGRKQLGSALALPHLGGFGCRKKSRAKSFALFRDLMSNIVGRVRSSTSNNACS